MILQNYFYMTSILLQLIQALFSSSAAEGNTRLM